MTVCFWYRIKVALRLSIIPSGSCISLILYLKSSESTFSLARMLKYSTVQHYFVLGWALSYEKMNYAILKMVFRARKCTNCIEPSCRMAISCCCFLILSTQWGRYLFLSYEKWSRRRSKYPLSLSMLSYGESTDTFDDLYLWLCAILWKSSSSTDS